MEITVITINRRVEPMALTIYYTSHTEFYMTDKMAVMAVRLMTP
jgi:hypothetical protein